MSIASQNVKIKHLFGNTKKVSTRSVRFFFTKAKQAVGGCGDCFKFARTITYRIKPRFLYFVTYISKALCYLYTAYHPFFFPELSFLGLTPKVN